MDRSLASSAEKLPDKQKPVDKERNKTAQAKQWRSGSVVKLAPSVLVLSVAVIFAAGRPPWVLTLCALLAIGGLILNKPPNKKSLLFLWWVGMAFFVWNLFTLFPLPIHSLGHPRHLLFQQAHQKTAELENIFSGNHVTAAAVPAGNPGIAGTSHNDDVSGGLDQADQEQRYGRLTLNQAGTRRFIVVMAGAWAMFWLTTAMTLSQRLRFLSFLVFLGAVVAVLGLAGYYLISPGERVWWFFPVDYMVGAGPFINRNHFASFCALLAPAALSLLLEPFSRSETGGSRSKRHSGRSRTVNARSSSRRSHSSRRRRHSRSKPTSVRQLFSLVRLSRRHVLYALCFLALVSAPIMILSRGGMVMMLIGCFTASLFWLGGKPFPAIVGGLVMIGLLFAFVLWPTPEVRERISTIRELQDASPRRVQMTRKALEQWRDFPILGGGADSFRTLNSLYKTRPSITFPLYSENEYVQFLADHGLMGLLFVVLMAGALGLSFWSNFHDRYQRTRSLRFLRGTWSREEKTVKRHQELYAPVVSLPILAATSGMVTGLLFHLSCDFPLRVPLLSFTAAAILGMAMPLPASLSSERAVYWRRPLRFFIPLALIIVIVWSGERIRLDEPAYLRRADPEVLLRAAAGAPSYWIVWLHLSQQTREMALGQLYGGSISVTDHYDPFRLYQYSVECLERAAELNSYNPRLWRSLARAQRLIAGDAAAEKVYHSYRLASRLDPSRFAVWEEWLSYTLGMTGDEKIWELGQTAKQHAAANVAVRILTEIRDWARDEGLKEHEYRAVVMLAGAEPENSRWWEEKARLETDEATHEEAIRSRRRVAELRPDDWRNWLALGRLLLKNNQNEAANRAFSRALSLQPDLRDEVDRIWRESQSGN